MPYVEGFGTWPFGEEWLWEAMATSYLPLLDVLDAHPGRVTVSLTPVLCDQLEAPRRARALPRLPARDPAGDAPARHRRGRGSRARARARALRGAVRGGRRALRGARGRPRAARSPPHVSWTSSATHAVLPLLATAAGVRLQVGAGIAAHRERFGHWDGGFWLPECGHAPWLDPLLEEAGVHAACVDLTDVLGYGAPAQLRPLRSDAGPLLVPIDRALMDLVWHTSGYPSAGAVPQYAPPHRVPPHAVGGRRRALRPGARRRPGPRARARLRGGGGAAARGRRARGLRARHRAARALLARGRRLARRGDRGVRRGGRRAAPGSTPRCAATEAVPAPAELPGHELGRAARPRDLERAAGGRARHGARARRSCACSAPGRPSEPARAARAAGAPGLRLGVRRDPRDRRSVLARAGRRARRRARARARRSGRNRLPHCATLHLHSTCRTLDFRVRDVGEIWPHSAELCAYSARLLELNTSRIPAEPVAGNGGPTGASAPGANRRLMPA